LRRKVARIPERLVEEAKPSEDVAIPGERVFRAILAGWISRSDKLGYL
jgi:hypothetical protein